MFSAIRLKAHAKINLCLDIIGVRDDGYHMLESIMQSLELHDSVFVRKTRCDKIKIDCPIDVSPEKNTAYKAAKEFFKETNITGGVEVKIKKRIPEKAGMGGGSADAAAVLVAMNKLFKTDLSSEALCKIGEKVGADVPFCITGGTMLVRGIGEILTRLDDCCDCHIVVAKGKDGVSTAKAYAEVDVARRLERPKLEKIIDAISSGEFASLKGRLVNLFQQCTKVDDVEKIISKMRDMGAIESAMTGSGSAVFGIFEDKIKAKQCVGELEKEYPFVELTRPCHSGVTKY